MMLKIALRAAAVLALASVAYAGDQSDSEQSCDGNTLQMAGCLRAKAAEWDKRMNAAYQKAVRNAVPAQREPLRAAQRLWIRYRDANCLYYRMGEGTIATLNAVECMRSMTEARAKELEGLDHQ